MKEIYNFFAFCESLSYLPDISKWNTSNFERIEEMFSGCSSLSSLPDISKWNLSKVYSTNSPFSFCFSLSFIPDNINIKEDLYDCINCLNAWALQLKKKYLMDFY